MNACLLIDWVFLSDRVSLYLLNSDGGNCASVYVSGLLSLGHLHSGVVYQSGTCVFRIILKVDLVSCK
ncbi:hypothetical protein M758_8G100400 [Ceratodon purpureus]|nr:hypothetical protein M758_8G100400 [Ceratodon purpureus]